MTSAVSLRGVTFSRHYGQGRRRRTTTIFKDFDLDIKNNDRIGVIGGNGVGKTTLLRLLSGVLEPDQGEVIVRTPARVILDPAVGLDPALTARDNARTLLILQGCEKSLLNSRLDEIGSFSELGSFFDEPVKTFSAGMTSRLVVAVQLLGVNGTGLLIDEGIGTADAQFHTKVLNELDRRVSSVAYLVLASHDVGTLSRYCSRGLLLARSGISYDGTIREAISLYEKSATEL